MYNTKKSPCVSVYSFIIEWSLPRIDGLMSQKAILQFTPLEYLKSLPICDYWTFNDEQKKLSIV